MGNPTAPEQLLLELTNLARTDPRGEFDRYIVNPSERLSVDADITNALRYFKTDMGVLRTQLAELDPLAPLAWNVNLARSADTHNRLMIQYDDQTHSTPGEEDYRQRALSAGYEGFRLFAENIYAYAENPLHAHASLFYDWGAGPNGILSPPSHRINIMNTDVTEVGISALPAGSHATKIGPLVLTQHLGTRRDSQPMLVGVVIADADGDDFYGIGEGLGNVRVQAVGAAGTFTTSTWGAGGYQMTLPEGSYTVTFAGGGLVAPVARTVRIGAENAKLDVVVDGESDGGGGGPAPQGPEITGTTGDDVLTGTAASERIVGLAGDDHLRGQGGDDVLEGGPGADLLDGGEGRDTASYTTATRSVRVDLENDQFMFGDAVGDTFRSIEIFRTGRFADQLRGDADDNVFFGGGSSDRLYGRGGDDYLNGEGGADALYGNAGADTMVGGPGAVRDRFIYFHQSDSGVGPGQRDVILDFVAGEDRIEISRLDADPTTPGKQRFHFIGDDAFSGAAGELRFSPSTSATLVQADVDGDRAADFEIELAGRVILSVEDFFLG